ncbi:MAG: sulfatase-like hydrolase/transferase, partial [Planctomycetota bacterium]
MFRLTFALAIIGIAVATTASADQPNILLIMADDVGIEGLGCYGGQSYRTPNLDRMAMEGMRFSNAYAQPLCTPTRVQLMTGKYNHRNWRSFGILDPNERTFGHALSTVGYATGIFGKWQLQSYDPPELPGAAERRGTGMHPMDSGFDEYALFHALHTEDKGSRYANPTMLEGCAGQPGTLETYDGRYGEDIWVEKILSFFDRNANQPKFVYYPMALPHWPFEPTPNSTDWNPNDVPEADVKYQKYMIEYMDTIVGRLLDGLRARETLKDTIVIFYSDNGTHLKVTSRMRDGRIIRGGKATSQQTGIHVPLIVRWEGRIQASVSDTIIDASDFFPTLLELSQAPTSVDQCRTLDGISFAKTLLGKSGPQRREAFFWYDPRPGWDKERFRRSVFAVNKTHKYFRDGRLLRLGARPLSETLIPTDRWTSEDRSAAMRLGE